MTDTQWLCIELLLSWIGLAIVVGVPIGWWLEQLDKEGQ